MPSDEIPQQYLILDTCVVQYLGTKEIKEQLLNYLIEVESRGFHYAISDFSIYELLQGVSASKESELQSRLQNFNRYAVETNILIAAAQIKTLYDMEKLPQTQISDGDKVIAATSILTGSSIVTANFNDFPRPYFVEMERQNILYKHKNVDRLLPVYIVAPDFSVINFRFANRPKN